MPVPDIYAIPGFSEPFSSMTHLLAAGVFLALGSWLTFRNRTSLSHVVSLSVFTFSCVFLLAMSGVFHLLEPGGSGRAVLQRLDHAGIFVLIAGTFTPVHGILFRGWWRWGMLILIWAVAITGLTLKTIFFSDISEWLGLTFYLGLGWVGLVSAILLYRRFGTHLLYPLLYGALAYTLGAVMEFVRFPVVIPGVIGPHEMFHVAVLMGLSLHFVLVHRFCRPVLSTNFVSSQG